MYSTKNVTVRCYEVDSDAIQRAADRSGKTLSDYCRDVLIPWAYSDLGEKRPNLPPLERGRYSSMIDQAAKAAGMSREQFERRAAEQMAAAEALGVAGPLQSAGSGLRPAVRLAPPARPARKDSAQRRTIGQLR
jgi:uncharacterized protein (DUF1778 family)